MTKFSDTPILMKALSEAFLWQLKWRRFQTFTKLNSEHKMEI